MKIRLRKEFFDEQLNTYPLFTEGYGVSQRQAILIEKPNVLFSQHHPVNKTPSRLQAQEAPRGR